MPSEREALLAYDSGCDYVDRRARAAVRDLVRRYGADAVEVCLRGLPESQPVERAELLAERLAVSASAASAPPSGREAVEAAERREREAHRAAVESWRWAQGAAEKRRRYQSLFRRFLAGEFSTDAYLGELRRVCFEEPPLPSAAARSRLESWFEAAALPVLPRRDSAQPGPMSPHLAAATASIGEPRDPEESV